MAKIVLCSSPVVEVSKTGGYQSYTVSPMDDVLPRETVDIETLADVAAAFDGYVAKVKATGLPGQVNAYWGRQAASNVRKPRGFDAAKLDCYVNTEALEAAA